MCWEQACSSQPLHPLYHGFMDDGKIHGPSLHVKRKTFAKIVFYFTRDHV